MQVSYIIKFWTRDTLKVCGNFKVDYDKHHLMYFKTHMFHNPFSQVFPALIAFISCWFKHTSSRSARSQFRLIQLFNIGPAHQLSSGKALKKVPNRKIETKYCHILIIKATLDYAISLYILTQYSQSLKKNTKKRKKHQVSFKGQSFLEIISWMVLIRLSSQT